MIHQFDTDPYLDRHRPVVNPSTRVALASSDPKQSDQHMLGTDPEDTLAGNPLPTTAHPSTLHSK